MTTYRLSNALAGPDGRARLSEFAETLPGQAAGILLAIHELGGAERDVYETGIAEYLHIPETYARLWPGSKPDKNKLPGVASTIGLYRQAFKKLPFLKLVVTRGRRPYAHGPRKPDTLTDPLTGETFKNPFLRRKRPPAKARKTVNSEAQIQ